MILSEWAIQLERQVYRAGYGREQVSGIAWLESESRRRAEEGRFVISSADTCNLYEYKRLLYAEKTQSRGFMSPVRVESNAAVGS